MRKKFKKENTDPISKTIKLDPKTHKLLRMYALKNDLYLGEAVGNLLNKDKATKNKK